jgi:hypothetical protein
MAPAEHSLPALASDTWLHSGSKALANDILLHAPAPVSFCQQIANVSKQLDFRRDILGGSRDVRYSPESGH